MNYRTIADLNNTILKNLCKIPRDIDLVVGVPRSGMLPANLIALYLNLPYTDIDSFIEGRIYKYGERGAFATVRKLERVLIVDDSVCSGKAMLQVKDKIQPLIEAYKFIFCSVYQYPPTIDLVDIYFELVELPRLFQWNIIHNPILSVSCVDIDGVLCVDPTNEENDDGEKYISFLRNARPLYIPSVKIHTLVSCRLEKYRELTDIWLRQNGVEYDNLILLDLPNKDARIKWGKYGLYKANVYMSSPCKLFVESSLSQSEIILHKSKKAVFCTEDFNLYNPMPKNRLKSFLKKKVIASRKIMFNGKYDK